MRNHVLSGIVGMMGLSFLVFLVLPGSVPEGEPSVPRAIFAALSGQETAVEEWRRLFNEGESLVLEGRMDEAESKFIEMIRMGSGGDEREVATNWFFRLNRSHFQRFPVRGNIARGGGVLGTKENRLFSFFGMPESVNSATFADAYDAAILYWQEIALLSGRGSRFDGELDGVLREEPGHPAEEILALGIAGFPRLLLERIAEYVEREPADPDVDSFIFQVINRYVPSVQGMPDLRDPMATLTDRVGGRLAGAMGSPDERLRIIQRQAHILGRLNEPERLGELLDGEMKRNLDAGAVGAWANLGLAVRLEDFATGQALFQQLWALPDEELPVTRMELNGARIHIVGMGLRSGEAGVAASSLAEYARYVLRRSTPEGAIDPFLLQAFWWEPGFPTFNPYLPDGLVHPLAQFLPALAEGGQIDTFLALLDAGMTDEPLPETAEKQVAFLSACALWWFGDRDEALRILREEADRDADSSFALLLASMEVRLFQEAEPLLTSLPAEPSPESRSADVFLYLLGGQWGRFDLLRQAAGRILRHPLSVEEMEQWASRFLQDSLYEETAAILERIEASELEAAEERRFLGVTFRYYQRVGRAKEKAPLARDFLLESPPGDFNAWNRPVRRQAIELLRSAGEIENYRGDVAGILKRSPDSREGLLLLAELSVPGERELARLPASAINERIEETRILLGKAVDTDEDDYETRLDYGEWLADNEYYDEAAALFDRLIAIDPVPLFVDQSLLFGVYEAAGRLAELVSFFDAWEMPYAVSIDAFYGLQPTSYLLENLGSRLQRQGDAAAAVKAWKHGVRLNPVIFTEETRVALVKQLVVEQRTGEVMDLLEDYLFRESPGSSRFVVHPFPSVLPPWLNSPPGREVGNQSPLFSLLEAVDAGGMEKDLLERAESGYLENPGDLSRRGFFLLMLARQRDFSFFAQWDSFLDSGGVPEAGPDLEPARALLRLLLPLLEPWESAKEAVSEMRGLLEQG